MNLLSVFSKYGLQTVFAVGALSSHSVSVLAADVAATLDPRPVAEERFAIHGQATLVEQATDGFRAPYRGPNSLSRSIGRETFDATLFIGARLWGGAEAWLSPEIDQGFGLDNTLGAAGFPSGEAYKVGKKTPYLRLPRAFVRQVIDTGAVLESVEATANQLGGSRSIDRWVLTVGKFGVTDVFDTNRYAHDPRADFLNWSAIDSGSFDYAADAWGFTVGAAVERYAGAWALRLGVFDLSNIPNSSHLEPALHEFQIDAEIEKRYALFGLPGRVLLTVFDSRGRMGLLREATELAFETGTTPDPATVRQFRSRLGVHAGIEQPVTDDMGVFFRIGKAAGNVETYEFTDIDRSVELGVSLQGPRWRRPADSVGFAAIDNRISADRERFLNAGGLGILVGDGQLPHPGAEHVLEAFYSAAALRQVFISVDCQWISNPAYNKDRGPVSVFALRVHGQF